MEGVIGEAGFLFSPPARKRRYSVCADAAKDYEEKKNNNNRSQITDPEWQIRNEKQFVRLQGGPKKPVLPNDGLPTFAANPGGF